MLFIKLDDEVIYQRVISDREVIEYLRPKVTDPQLEKSKGRKMQKAVVKTKRTCVCKLCNSPGHTAKTCKMSTKPLALESSEETPEGAMDKKTFMMIRKCKHDERPVAEVADSFHLDEHEVEVAYRCTGYESYLALR